MDSAPTHQEAEVPAETHLEGTPIGRTEVLELIRDRLAEAGIQLKDSREGTNWE